MAIYVLIRLYDGTGGRTAGDIVDVRSARLKGPMTKSGRYAEIEITNMDLPAFKQYHTRHYRVEDDTHIYSSRSRYRIDLASMPAVMRTELFTNYFYSINRNTAISLAKENDLIVKAKTTPDGNN